MDIVVICMLLTSKMRSEEREKREKKVYIDVVVA
jgi:hypothetical protein